MKSDGKDRAKERCETKTSRSQFLPYKLGQHLGTGFLSPSPDQEWNSLTSRRRKSQSLNV